MAKIGFIASLASAVASSDAVKLGNPSTSSILNKAHPYKRNSNSAPKSRRRLDVELNGSYNIQFSQCVDVKLRDDDLFQDEVIDYVQEGDIISTKSYVLFHLCANNTCFYESEDDLYMVDLSSYLTNAAQYHASKRTNYCNACNEFANYCTGDDASAVEEEAAAEEGAAAEEAVEEEQVVEEEAAAEEEAAEEQQADANGELFHVEMLLLLFLFVGGSNSSSSCILL